MDKFIQERISNILIANGIVPTATQAKEIMNRVKYNDIIWDTLDREIEYEAKQVIGK